MKKFTRSVAASVAFSLCLSSSPLSFAQTTLAAVPQGQFGISSAGAATYSIPIQVPPGINGMAPQLQLSYNSQAGSSGGLMGMAWSLGGLSSVTRCPQTIAQDGVRGSVKFDDNDRYCLDGKRLILVSGTYGQDGAQYRSEFDNFSKIVSYGRAGSGAASFKVWTKDGRIMEYGNTADSLIELVRASSATVTWPNGTARTWALSKVFDASGNYLTVSYNKDTTNGVYSPARIDYAGNSVTATQPQSSVRFVYQALANPIAKYQAGAVSKLSTTLSEIGVYSGSSTLVSKVMLSYQSAGPAQVPRLSSVQRCDGVGSCEPALNMTYVAPEAAYGYSATRTPIPNIGTVLSSSASGFVSGTMADVDGDGLPDFVGGGSTYASPPTTGFVRLNLGSGFAAPVPLPNVGVYLGTWGPSFGTGNSFVDVTGDGLPDTITAGSIYSSTPYDGTIRRNNGGVFSDAVTLPNVGVSLGATGQYGTSVLLIDVDGDGLPDVVTAGSIGSADPYMGSVRLNLGNGFAAPSPLPNIGFSLGSSGSYGVSRMMIDINGDGLPDIVDAGNPTGSTPYTGSVRYNTGSGFRDPVPLPNIGFSLGSSGNYGISVMLIDINGDGLPDLVVSGDPTGANPYTGSVRFNNGNGFNDPVPLPNIGTSLGSSDQKNATAMFIDINGDGLPDMLFAGYVSGSTLNDGSAILSVGQPIHHLLSVSSSTGPTTTITYSRLNDPTVYTKDSGANTAVYPVLDLMRSAPVVSSVSTSDGIGGINTVQYTYGGLKFEAGTGRGMLGFRWVNAKNLNTGIQNYTEYRQDFPFAGMPSKIETRLTGSGNGGVLKRITNTLGCNLPTTGAACTVAPGKVYYPFLATQMEESWDLNGTAYPSVTTTTQYSSLPHYGDPSQMVVSSSDGFSKTTAFEYWTADTTNWVVGKVKKTTVTSSK